MEDNHPIENLMVTAMNSIKDMIDVNTIIGEPINALNNTVIIPISKVGFGFAAGGSEFNGETVNSYNKKEKEENIKYRLPFGGGSGAGVSIMPVAFLIVQNESVRLLEATHSSVIDKLIEYIPDAVDKVNQIIKRKMDKDEEKSNEELEEDFEKDFDDDFDDEFDENFDEDSKEELKEEIDENLDEELDDELDNEIDDELEEEFEEDEEENEEDEEENDDFLELDNDGENTKSSKIKKKFFKKNDGRIEEFEKEIKETKKKFDGNDGKNKEVNQILETGNGKARKLEEKINDIKKNS